MLIRNNEIDLGKSFEQLKNDLIQSGNYERGKATDLASNLSSLQAAVIKHLTICTDEDTQKLFDELVKQHR